MSSTNQWKKVIDRLESIRMNELNLKLAEILRKDFEKKDNNQSVMAKAESWTNEMRLYGIRYFMFLRDVSLADDESGFVVRHPYFTGALLVPYDFAERVLVLGGLP